MASMFKTFPLSSRAKTAAVKQPKELFSYLRDIDGEWNVDEEALKRDAMAYFYLPDAAVDNRIDLGGGFSSFKKIPEEQNMPHFPSLLKALQQHEQAEGKKLKTDIVTFRGQMTKLLVLPYNLKDDVTMVIVPFDGQLFITSDDEVELARRKQNEPDDMGKRLEYSGYKFETIATLPRPWAETSREEIEKRHKKVVNNYEQYISVVKTGIGKVGITLAGEVDCAWDYIPENKKSILSHYVELKTSKVIETPGQVVTFERKLFKTWAQCFLLGIGKIVYGFRDNGLLLKSVEVFKTDEVPLLIKDNPMTQNQANKIVCMSALKWYGAVVEWIVNEVPQDDSAWKLHYDAGSRTLTLQELTGEDVKKKRAQVISPEFKQWRLTLA